MPIDPALLPAFLLAVAAVELTPGPNMAYLAVLSASRGRRAGLAAVIGITLGLAVYMLAAVTGLAEALMVYPSLLKGLRWAGVAFILWLAIEAWRGAAETSPSHTLPISRRGQAWRGFVANILNPKAAVFYLLLLPGFIAEGRAPAFVQALVLGCLHLFVSVVVHGAVVLFAARLGGLASSGAGQGHALVVRRVFALSLVLVAGWLALEAA